MSSTPLELRLQGKFADDVAFDVEFECEDDKVSVEGGIKDPPGIKFPFDTTAESMFLPFIPLAQMTILTKLRISLLLTV